MKSGAWTGPALALAALVVFAAGFGASTVSCKAGGDDGRNVDLGNRLKSLSDTQDAFAAVAAISRNVVVSITVREGARSDPLWDWIFAPPERVRGGTGIVVHPEGWILTNKHVVENAKSVVVTFADGREFRGERYKTASKTDLAFVKIAGSGFEVAKLGDSDKVRVGDWAIAVGSPFNFDQTLTVGVISAKGRKIAKDSRGGYETFLQTDAAINAGNSGGPLLNLAGEVIGVNTAIYSPTRTYAGIGFAIPINIALPLIADLKSETGPATDDGGAWLGVTVRELHEDEMAQLGVEAGIVVLQVTDGSPAQQAGLREFDVIMDVDGKPMTDRGALADIVEKAKQGDNVNLKVWRRGRVFAVPCCLGKR